MLITQRQWLVNTLGNRADSPKEKPVSSSPLALINSMHFPVTRALPPGHLSRRGFPRSLLQAPPGRRDYLTICQKGGLQNLWLFELQLFSVIVKKKLIIFSSKPPPLSPVQTITKLPKTTHLAFSVFTVFKTIIKRQKGVGDEGFFPAQHLKSNSIGRLLFSSGYFPSVPSSY